MNKLIFTLAICFIAIFTTSETLGQKFRRLDISPMDAAVYPKEWKNSDKLVKVIYGRPQLKGREMSSLAKVSKNGVWRTGANEATEITFFKDVLFGDKTVKAGTYTLFTIPAEKEWTFILSAAINVWGHYTYDAKDDVVRVKGKVSKSEKSIEAFSITFDNDNDNITMYLGWANTVASLPIKEVEKKE